MPGGAVCGRNRNDETGWKIVLEALVATQAPIRRIHSDLAQEPVKHFNHKSIIGLFRAIRELFTGRGIPEDPAVLTTYFVFSTWFADCLPVAPCLLIAGPRPEGHFLLDLLECVVCKPLPLVELTSSSFLHLAMRLKPTLLIDQEGSTRSIWNLLRASNRRNAQVSLKDGPRKIYCAKAVYCGAEAGDDRFDDSTLRIELSPSRGQLPVLDEKDKRAIAKDLQPKLRAYRHRTLAAVRASKFDIPEFTSAIRILSRILGAPIAGVPELLAGLRSVLQQYQDDAQARSWSDVRFVVIEALLYHCHQEQAKLHVGEIALTVNAILRGRGERREIEPKEIGAIVRRLGLSSKRDKKGFAIPLDNATRHHIHELGRRFDVIAVDTGNGCSSCAQILGTGDAINESATPSGEAG
jgi:hypothetical protein